MSRMAQGGLPAGDKASSGRDTLSAGGVPERTNGAVLKTAGRRKAARGFESHPRR
jgi:hypothetical protein